MGEIMEEKNIAKQILDIYYIIQDWKTEIDFIKHISNKPIYSFAEAEDVIKQIKQIVEKM